uniref:HNH endonuclease n=1 Tax=Microbulbifer sp. M83 TaxID=3118246 RepID=UPI002FDFA8BA
AANDADDITKTIRYNARGEQTWAQDGDGFVTQMAYDGAGRITKNISPDGTGSSIQYDAAGNQTLVYTGEIDSVAQPVSDDAINAEFGDMLVISWNMPQGVDQKSWVVWGSTSQTDITVDGQPAYDSQSAELGTWFSDTGEVYIPSEEFGEGEALYFRVVTADRAGNLAWSEEKVLRVPPTLGAIDVDRIDSDTTTITVEAGSNAQNVALKYGTAGATSTATPVAMQPNGDGTWTVTIDGVTNLDEKSFRISWQDAAGTDYESTEKTFVASDPHVGVTTQLGETTVMSGETTSYIINLDTRVPAETASQFSTVIATLTDDSGDTVTAAVEGVDNGDGTWSYLLDLGTSASPLAAGSYRISLEGAYADTSVFGAQELLLDQFSVELSETAALSGTRQGLTWQAADVGTEAGRTQLVLVDGQWVQSTRNADGQLFVSTELAPGTHSYNAFYGEQVGTGYSLDISSTEITEEVDDPENPGTTITNVLGYDQDFSLTLDPAEVANINGDLTLSWRAAGSGLDFTDSTVMAFDGTSHAATLPQLQEGAYDVKLSYTDADGNEVIVQWLRLDSAQVTSGTSQNYIGNSVTVLGSETGGSINVAANGLIDFSTGLYSGPGGDERNYVDITLDSNNNPGGTRTTNGVDAGYFTANRYNALNQLVATNEGNGIWRHFGVDANGNQVATYTTGENGDDLAAATEVRDSYAVFDGRNRMVTEYGVATGVFGETGLVRPETTYGYDVQDNQVSITDARGYNTSRDFNALGMMTWENDNRTGITYHHYDRLGNETKMVDQLGNETSKRYDTAGRLVEEINGEGDLKRYTYDAFGRRVSMSVVDTVGSLGERTTSFVYDNRDRLVKQTDAGGNELRFGYDNRDNRTHSWDIANDLTRQEYDGLNRVTLTEYEGVNGNLVNETRQYDAYGNLIAEKDAAGRVTSHEYGAFGRKIATIDQGGRKVAYEYDEFGNQVREYRPVTTSAINTGLWNFGFDGAELSREDFRFEFGKLYRSWDLFGTSGTSYSSGPDIHREYDDAGRLLTVWDKKTDIATTYQYDEMGNRMSEVVAEVDVNGDPTKTLRNISYDYDETGQMSRWHDSVTGQHLNYLWDAAGNQKRVYTDVGYAGEAVNHWYNYDGANRVTQMLDGQAGDIISGFTYDGLGQRAIWSNNGTDVTYRYNDSGWVTDAVWTDDKGVHWKSLWEYDADGNVTSYETWETDANEVLQSRETYSHTTYSANGISTFSDSDDQKTYSTYDDSGRLLKTKLVTEDATYTYTYYYHGDGREQKIVGKGDAKGTSTYTYDANDKLTRLDKGKGDNQDSKEYLTFVYNNDGQILYRYHDEGTDNDISETEFQYANGHAVGEKKTWQNGDPAEEKLDTGDYNLMQNIGEDYPSGAVTSVTAVDGDSLQSIAARVYGNPSLWFVLAAANGLDPSQPIKGGVKISVPNTVETGRLDADTHKVYNENDIIGSTLPNLKTPESDDDCGNILMIIIVVVIAVVATWATGGLAGSLAQTLFSTTLAEAGLAATIASYAIAGAIVGAAASIVQQGLFIALGYQEEFSWKDVAAGAVAGAFTGAAQGLGKAVQAGKVIAKASEAYAKVATSALKVAGAASKQLITSGKITSWASLAGAALAPTNDGISGDELVGGLGGIIEGAALGNMVTPWLEVAETYIREGELTTGDWVAAVGSTIGAAVGTTDKFQIAGSNLGANVLIGGAMSLFDKDAGQQYIANAVGNEIGSRVANDFIAPATGLKDWAKDANGLQTDEEIAYSKAVAQERHEQEVKRDALKEKLQAIAARKEVPVETRGTASRTAESAGNIAATDVSELERQSMIRDGVQSLLKQEGGLEEYEDLVGVIGEKELSKLFTAAANGEGLDLSRSGDSELLAFLEASGIEGLNYSRGRDGYDQRAVFQGDDLLDIANYAADTIQSGNGSDLDLEQRLLFVKDPSASSEDLFRSAVHHIGGYADGSAYQDIYQQIDSGQVLVNSSYAFAQSEARATYYALQTELSQRTEQMYQNLTESSEMVQQMGPLTRAFAGSGAYMAPGQAQHLQGIAKDVGFSGDNLAPAALREGATDSLMLEAGIAALSVAPGAGYAATKLNLGEKLGGFAEQLARLNGFRNVDELGASLRAGEVVPNKTVTGSDLPYNSRNVRNDLVDVHGVENVSSTTIPPINAKNVKLAGQRHPVTGIVFDNKGFPIFDDVAAFDTRLPIEPFRNASYTDQMKMATSDLGAAIQRGEVNPSAFSANQLSQIQSGSKTVDGFTWHHHQDTGRMQLVPRDIHKRTGHVGWEAMSDGK